MAPKRKSMKGGHIYKEDDLQNTVTVNNVEFIALAAGDTQISDAEDEYNKVLHDPVTYSPISKNNAFLLHGIVYDIYSIYDWVVKYNHNTCPYKRQPITSTEKQDIINKYNSVARISRISSGSGKVKYIPSNNSIILKSNITRGDFFILDDGEIWYSYTFYGKGYPIYFIYGAKSLGNIGGTLVPLHKIKDYVLKSEERYNQLLLNVR